MDLLQTVLSDQEHGALKEIAFLQDEGSLDVRSVKLLFPRTVIYISVNPDDDTIVLSQEPPSNTQIATLQKPVALWAQLVGKRIQWYWWLENNQGYRDGLQIEFVPTNESGPGLTVQVIALASRIVLREVVALIPDS